MAEYLSGSGQAAENWLAEEWPAEIDVEAQEKAVLFPQIRQLPAPKQIIHIPRFDNLSSSVFSATLASTTGLTAQSNLETEFTATSRMRVLLVTVSFDTLEQMALDPMNEIRQAIVASVSSGIDSDVLALAGSLAANVAGDPLVDINFGAIAESHRMLVTGAKEFFEPRERSRGIAVLAATQDDHLISIEQLTSAQVRGDRINPIVSGWITTGLGTDFYESTNVQVSGSQANNVVLVPRAMGIGFNQRTTVKGEDFEVWKKIIAWAHYAYGTIRPEYAVLLRSPST